MIEVLRKGPGPEEVPGQEEHVGRSLSQPAHEVGIPLAAKGNVDAHLVAVAHQLALQIAAHSIQHLKLEMAGSMPRAAAYAFDGCNHGLVVRGQRVIDGAVEEQVAEA